MLNELLNFLPLLTYVSASVKLLTDRKREKRQILLLFHKKA